MSRPVPNQLFYSSLNLSTAGKLYFKAKTIHVIWERFSERRKHCWKHLLSQNMPPPPLVVARKPFKGHLLVRPCFALCLTFLHIQPLVLPPGGFVVKVLHDGFGWVMCVDIARCVGLAISH